MLNSEESTEISLVISDKMQAFFDPEGTIEVYKFHAFVRKLAHFLEFTVLGVVLSCMMEWYFRRKGNRPIFLVLFLSLATAVADEFIQSYTGRSSMVKDIVIDFGGALTGIVLTVLVVQFLRICRSRK